MTTSTDTHTAQAATFLGSVFGDALETVPESQISVFSLPNQRSQFTDIVQTAATWAEDASRNDQDTYVGVGLYRSGITQGRGKIEDVVCIPALWLDLDIKNDHHAGKAYPETVEQAIQVASCFLKPSITISTGGGIHLWWLLKEPLATSDGAAELSRRWQVAIRIWADAKYGWEFDATHDLARVLRIPGTTNHKYGTFVEVIEASLTRYDVDDFEAFVSNVQEYPARREDSRSEDARSRSPAADYSGADDDLLEKAKAAANGEKFARLFCEGDCAGYASNSEADLALSCILAFWFSKDPERIDRVFRRSKLYRPKWDERRGNGTYGSETIATAIAHTHATYKPIEACTDLGNCTRFVRMHVDKARYVHSWKKWLIWDGRQWAKDESGQVVRLAKQVPGEILREAAHVLDRDGDKDSGNGKLSDTLTKHARHTQSRRRLTDLVALSESELTADPSELDRDPWLFNVANGTIDLRTGTLLPHNRDDLITRIVDVAYNPDAQCPYWIESLRMIFQGDAELIGFVQRAIGYSVTGMIDERCFFILWGDGWNGKSIFIETINRVLGPYGTTTPITTIMRRSEKHAGPSNDLAALKGIRFVSVSEAPENARLGEAKIKSLTGGDTIPARFLYGEFFSFEPQFKLWLATNHKPTIQGADQAIWDRIKLVPFTFRFKDTKENKSRREVVAMFESELPGILAWAVRGCLDWQIQGLGDVAAVTEATVRYREEMDDVQRFVGDICTTDDKAESSATELYKVYKQWADNGGERPVSQKEFSQRLERRAFRKAKHPKSRRSWWYGIGLMEQPRD